MVDTDNVHFINFREIKKMTVESVEKIMILLDILVTLLFVLSFYQLLLSLVYLKRFLFSTLVSVEIYPLRK